MESRAIQAELFPLPEPPAGTIFVNERVTLRSAEGFRVVTVGGAIFHHFAIGDRMAEAYAMVTLVEAGYADQNDVARSFGYADRTLRRYQERFAEGGLVALGHGGGRPPGRRSIDPPERIRDRTILRLKSEGFGNRTIGRRLGLTARAIRKRLRRLGWNADSKQGVLFPEPGSPSSAVRKEAPAHEEMSRLDSSGEVSAAASQIGTIAVASEGDDLQRSFDADPRHRSFDRLLAAMGLLDDAAPLFASASAVPRAGVLLAIPGLVASGVLAVAERSTGVSGPPSTGSGRPSFPSSCSRSSGSSDPKR